MFVSSDVAAVPHRVTKAFLLTALSFNPHFLLTLTKRCEYTVHANYAQDYPIDPTTLITICQALHSFLACIQPTVRRQLCNMKSLFK